VVVEASEGACDFLVFRARVPEVPPLTAVCVSSSVVGESGASLCSAIEALSGVVATLEAALGEGVPLVSALTRIRRACSNTSSVISACTCTRILVYRPRSAPYYARRMNVTHRDEDVPLHSDRSQHRTKTHPSDPHPRADDTIIFTRKITG
jgi:hypothetical protein